MAPSTCSNEKKCIKYLGVMIDESLTWKHTLQLNYIYLVARYHIWKAKLEETAPNFVHFLRLVKSRFTIETTAGEPKKWTPLADCL